MPIASSLTPVGLKDILLDLILALQSLPTSRLLPSKGANKNLFIDLSRLNSAVNADDFDIGQFLPLLGAILSDTSDRVIQDKVYAAVADSAPPPFLTRPTTPPQYTASFQLKSEKGERHLLKKRSAYRVWYTTILVRVGRFSEAEVRRALCDIRVSRILIPDILSSCAVAKQDAN